MVQYKDKDGTYEFDLSRMTFLAFTKENCELLNGLDDAALARVFRTIYQYVYNDGNSVTDTLSGIEGVIGKVIVDGITRISYTGLSKAKGLKNQENKLTKVEE